MFARKETNHLAVSCAASSSVKSWEQILGLRILLQKSIDTANQLPPFDVGAVLTDKEASTSLTSVRKPLVEDLRGILSDLVSCNKKKRKHDEIDVNDNTDTISSSSTSTNQLWSLVYEGQRTAEDRWKTVLNKWHARIHFGSEQAKSKMKVFNASLWDQVSHIGRFA